MRPYSEAFKADVRRRMGPPHRQSVAEIAQTLGIHLITLYKWRKAWRLQGEVVPASQKDPEGWGPADKFTVVLETAGLNATELGGDCRERGLLPEQVDRWRQAAKDTNAQPLLTMAEQKDLEKRHQADQREIKRLQHELRRKDTAAADRHKAIEILYAAMAAGARARVVAALLGVGLTTLQRWRRQFAGDGDGQDGRKGSPRLVSHRLTDAERQRILLT